MAFEQIDTIQTPLAEIALLKDDERGALWIKQNQLTVAMGYNKYLSKTHSRLGQFIMNAGALKKAGKVNMLNLQKVVEHVLPLYLKGFFGTLHGQPSRRQFFNNEPNTIYHHTVQLLEVLRGKLDMCYDPNSLAVKKGALGEKIAKKCLEQLSGHALEKPNDTFTSGASIVDFVSHHANGDIYYEVKTQIAYPYGIEKAMLYSFPTSRINAYKKYAEEHDVDIMLVIVDPSDGYIYEAPLDVLEELTTIDARQYPFDKYNEALGGEFHYWHREQFSRLIEISPDELAELQKLFGINGKATDLKTRLSVFLSDDKLDELERKLEHGEALTDFERINLQTARPEVLVKFNPCADIIASISAGDETPPSVPPTPKKHIEALASFAGIGQADLAEAILELRETKFEREQEQMKAVLLNAK